MSSSKRPVSEPTLDFKKFVIALGRLSVWSKLSKIGVQEFQIRPKFLGTESVDMCLLDDYKHVVEFLIDRTFQHLMITLRVI